MAITTLNGALTGAMLPQPFIKIQSQNPNPGVPQSFWQGTGIPAAGTAPANTAGGTALSSTSAQVTGQLFHLDPTSGNAYLGRLSGVAAGQTGMLLLCDRLLQCAGTTAGTAISVTATTAQTVNTTTLPARDGLGTTQGFDVLAGLEIISTIAGSATVTLGYTNNYGTTGQSATNQALSGGSPKTGACVLFNLAAGSYGIRSIQTLTLSGSLVSGTICLVLFRILAALEITAGGDFDNAIDAFTSCFPQVYNGTVPYLMMFPSLNNAVTIQGTYVESQG